MSEENKKEVPNKEAEIVSIHDFKSMLIGMDLILGDEWTPDENQWKRIRKKIDALIETAERPVTNTRNFITPTNVDYGPSVVDNSLLAGFPPVPVAENVPVGGGAPATPSALTPPPARPVPVADVSGSQVKTPDIDSSQGYKSGFV